MASDAFPVTKFVVRHSVVALVPEPQRDEPPGRGDVKTTEVVVCFVEDPIMAGEVKHEVANMTRVSR